MVKSIEVYGEMHRYIPLIAKWAGFKKIGEKVVEHRARKYGRSKFGMSRFDQQEHLIWLRLCLSANMRKRPMHFFGTWGSSHFFWVRSFFIYLTISKCFLTGPGLTQRPLFFFAILAMIIGTQLFVTGFIAELISRNAPGRNSYLIEEKLGL